MFTRGYVGHSQMRWFQVAISLWDRRQVEHHQHFRIAALRSREGKEGFEFEHFLEVYIALPILDTLQKIKFFAG